MKLRIGQILVERGVLTAPQVRQALARQERSGEPLGMAVEALFGVDPATIEEAWAHQYAGLTRHIDPRTEIVDPRALELVTRRQAWQFRILPVRFDGDELMLATTEAFLPRSLRFATNVIGIPVYLVLSCPDALGEALCRYYPLPGMKPDDVNVNGPEQLTRR